MADDYEIMPYKEVMALKKEMGALKKKMASPASAKGLVSTMSRLSDSMDSMLHLFTAAAEEMKEEESTEEKIDEKLNPLVDKLDQIIDQNRTIAEGLVAIADIIREKKHKNIDISEPIHHEPMHTEPVHLEPEPRPPKVDLPPAREPEQFKPDLPDITMDNYGLPPLDQPMGPPPNEPDLPPLNPIAPPPGGMPRPKKRGIFGR